MPLVLILFPHSLKLKVPQITSVHYQVETHVENRGFPKPTHFWGVPLIVLNFKYDLALVRKRLR